MEVRVAACQPQGANLVLTTGPSSLLGDSDTMGPKERKNVNTI